MARIEIEKDELCKLILEEMSEAPVCPVGMGVEIEPTKGSWRVVTHPPDGSPIAYADCTDFVSHVAARLREVYSLKE